MPGLFLRRGSQLGRRERLQGRHATGLGCYDRGCCSTTCVDRHRGGSAGIPVVQVWCLDGDLWNKIGPRCPGGWLWYHGWQRLLEGEEFLGGVMGHGRIHLAREGQGQSWRTRHQDATILPGGQQRTWAFTRALATVTTIATITAIA